MKECFKCKKIKPLSEFYKHKQMADGHLNKCKECNKKDVRKNYRDNIDHYKEYEQGRANLPHRVLARNDYSKTDAYKESHGKSNDKWKKNNTEKRKAHNKISNALRDKKIKKQPCFICGSTENIHGHHYDYSKPLNVIWLCPQHHKWMHTK